MAVSRKLDMEDLRILALFEKVTKAHVKDVVDYKEKMTFIVGKGQLWKAIGKDKANLLKLEQLLQRKVKIVEYNDDKIQFIINLIHPLKVVNIEENDEGIITIKGPDTKTKGLMIGARAQNLRATENIVRMYFDCKEIKVI